MDRHLANGIKIALLLLLALIFVNEALALSYKSGWPKSSSGRYYSPTLADLDGDGDREVLIPGGDGRIYILDASGNSMSGWPAGVESEATSPAVGSLGGNSLKIVSGSSKIAHQTAAYLGGYINAWNTNGALNWSVAIDTAIQSSPSLADINGDGQLEVIAGAWDNKVYALGPTGNVLWNTSTLGKISSSPAVADIDREGSSEVIIGSDDGSLYALRNNGAIYWSTPLGISGRSTAVIGDINFDGGLEIVVGTCSKIYALSNTGTVLWSANIQTCYPSLGDIDRDGDLEVVAGALSEYPNNKVHVLHANGSTMTSISLRGSDASSYERVVSTPIIGDVDDDGYPEIIVTTNSISEAMNGRLYAFDRFGNKLWHQDIGNLDATTRGPSPALEDLDNDGLLEVIAPSTTGTVHVFQLSARRSYLPWPMFQRDELHSGLYDLPLLRVDSPRNGSSYRQDELVSFSAQGFTARGAQPSFTWTSSVDGVLSSEASFTRSGLSSGSRLITAAAIDERGRNVSLSMTIQITNVPPTASIISPSNGSVFQKNSAVSFVGIGSDASGVVAKYEWDFEGDGTYDVSSTTTGNATHIYSTAGIYTARLRVTDADGAASIASVSLRINDLPTVAIASPSNNSIFNAGDAVSLVGVAVDSDGSIALYEWDFEADGVYDYTSMASGSTTHTYTTVGSRTARFRATDNDGANATAQVTLRVNDLPIAMINLPRSGDEFKFGRVVSFEGSAFDSDGSIAASLWNSSRDGVLSTSASFDRSNLSIGTHVITFIATDNDGARDSDDVSITIKPLGAPSATIVQPLEWSEFSAKDVVSFVGSGSDVDGFVVSYNWTSSLDGLLSTSAVFNTSSLSVGDHVITLMVRDDDGLTGSARVNVVIKPLIAPTATIVQPLEWSEFSAKDVVSFVGSGSDVDGFVVSYNWTSSLDGVLSTSASFDRSNLSIGTHVIKFIVADDDGLTGSANITVVIKPLGAPSATIVQPLEWSEFSAKDVVSFVGSGSDVDGFVVSYNWTSSLDGLLSTSAVFNTSSLSVGDHVITLMVRDDDGLTGSARIRVEIKTQLVAPPAGGGSGGGGGGGAPPGIPPIERIRGAQDLIAGNRGFFSTKELYLAPPQLAGVLGSLGIVPVPKDEAKTINRLTGGGVRALQGDPYEIVSELLLMKHVRLERAIVSRGDLQVDSLAGLVYAKHLGIPILIVEPDGIPAPMRRALSALGVGSTIVLGGPVAVSNTVAEELGQIDRIAGGDRYETAVRIAEALMSQRAIVTVVITDGASPNADAVVAAILYNAPIIYVKGDEIPPATMEFLRRYRSLNFKAVGITDAAFAKLSALF